MINQQTHEFISCPERWQPLAKYSILQFTDPVMLPELYTNSSSGKAKKIAGTSHTITEHLLPHVNVVF